jgi:outer membrane protein assembly factor BamE (lipoprotein component of BamABCDE complex)
MRNLFIFIIIALFFSACSLKIVKKHHGVHFLKNKHDKLIVNKSNKNDILNLLGSPSTKSTFDNDVWIYIERKTDNSTVMSFGEEKVLVNDVLVLEISSKGILKKKKLLDQNNMLNVEFTETVTNSEYKKSTFLYEFLSSLRQKINDPLGKRSKK